MTRALTNADEAEFASRFPFSAGCRVLRAIRDKIMPVLIAIALLAAAGAAQAQSISTELAQCLQTAPQKVQYSSTNGGQSALLMLLDNCKRNIMHFLMHARHKAAPKAHATMLPWRRLRWRLNYLGDKR
jgi:hypothetical protein